MKKKTLILSAAAVAVVGGLAFAQTMEGMDHSNMGGMGMGGMGDMGMMSHASMIPPELADNPAVQATQPTWTR
jgi:Spy/CpxP family protein refolding chaperone